MEEYLLQILRDSKYTVALSGRGMVMESGYPAIRDGEESYEIEQRYGYSSEEILSSSFYSTRKEQFYDFYRNEILKALKTPVGQGFYRMAELQKKGLIQSIITQRFYGLSERAGCENIINLHGSVYDNYCPHCGRTYPVEYIMESERIPLCEACSTPIRPRICLFGEMVDNGTMTKAAEEVSKADVLLVLGTNLKTYLCTQLVNYYEGDQLIVVSPEQHFSDKYANMIVHQRVDDTLGELLKQIGDKRP